MFCKNAARKRIHIAVAAFIAAAAFTVPGHAYAQAPIAIPASPSA